MVDFLFQLAQAPAPQAFNWDKVVKIVILVALYPVWLPVLKALYSDFQGALWEEGGLFGREPTPRELKELRQRYGAYRSPLFSETHEQYRERVRSGRGFRSNEDYLEEELTDGGLPSQPTSPRTRSF